MSNIETAFGFIRGDTDTGMVNRLVSEGKLHRKVNEDGEEGLYPSTGYMFQELREADLDENHMREIAYTLESRGLLCLRRTDKGWVWEPTLAGRNAGLCSHQKPLHIVLMEMGLSEELRNVVRLRETESELDGLSEADKDLR